MDLGGEIQARGGLAATHELLRAGHGRARLSNAVARGEIVRVRKGWYVLPDLPIPLQLAARVGGRLTCVSAAVRAGLWVPRHRAELHVAVRPNACQLRSATNYRKRLRSDERVVIHWGDAPDARLEAGPVSVISELCRCQSPGFAFVVSESALHQGYLTRSQWQRVLDGLPAATAAALVAVGPRSGSGTESIFKLGMLAEGIPFAQQVLLGRDRVDFLLGECLVVEIDSRGFHDPTSDCEREARLSVLGYRVLRFMYTQVIDDWPSVLASVRAAFARGDHLP